MFRKPDFWPVSVGNILYNANGQEVRAKDVIKNITLKLVEKDFSIDLFPIKLGSFDVVVGMD